MTQQSLVQNAIAFIQAHAPQGAKLCSDSRTVRPGDVFFAYPGDTVDGRQFVPKALQVGASAVLVEASGDEVLPLQANVHPVPNLKQLAGEIAHIYYGEPSTHLHLAGITGTNGKTTCSMWLAELLQRLSGKASGVIGTLGAGLLAPYGMLGSTGFTTPEAVNLHRIFGQFVQQSAAHACVEVSSIGLAEGRLNGAAFKLAAFTNLTQDHLDYHGSMQAYAQAKWTFFECTSLQVAVICIDDSQGAVWAKQLSQNRPEVKLLTTGISQNADFKACNVRIDAQGMQCFELLACGQSLTIKIAALGRFNVQNALTVITCAVAFGYELEQIARHMSLLGRVQGRMDVVNAGQAQQPLVIVDYAHTPDGLEQVLLALQPLAHARGGKLHLVFGCGGDRDSGKRAQMGGIAARLADFVTITNDNPRSEVPEKIAQDIIKGFAADTQYQLMLDRANAIEHTVRQAQVSDVVLIAGKGHETTQTIGASVFEFSDLEQARRALNCERTLIDWN